MSEYDELMEDLADVPERKFPPKPEVWALVEIEAEKSAWGDSKYAPVVPELTLQCRIIESAKDDKGREARGVEFVRLKKPPKGHPDFVNPPGKKDGKGNDISGKPSPRYGFMIGNYTSALAALLAPNVPNNKKNAEKVALAIAEALNAAGGDRVKACAGKRMLVKFQINDGCQGKDGDPTLPDVLCEYHGKPVIEKAKGRIENPKNEVNSFMAATEENIKTYVRAAQDKKASGW